MKRVFVVTWMILAGGLALAEDTLFLKDGKVIRGKILAVTQADVQIQTETETMRVPNWAIEKMEREEPDDATPVQGTEGKITRPTASAPQGRSFPDRPSPEPTPELLAWIELCVGKLASKDAGVRSGVAAALNSAGSAARPALERAAKSEDASVARDAQRLLTQLARVEERQAEAARPPRTRMDEMAEALGLEGDAAKTFTEVVGRFQVQQREVSRKLREGSIEVADSAVEMDKLRKKRDEELVKLLSPEQLKQYRERWANEVASGTTPAKDATKKR